MDESFTTSKAARILGVHPSTVVLWIDQGVVKAWRTAGGHRRVRVEDLKQYLLEHELPIPAELAGARPLRLLIVDDEQLALNALKRAFRWLAPHLELILTTSGVEALLLLAELKPDGMLIDFNMPDLDGLEVCRRVRARPGFSNVKLMMMSGLTRDRLGADALKAGAIAFLEKPVDPAEVLALIRDTAPTAGWATGPSRRKSAAP